MTDWLVVTDLDGTLLDHDSYDWAPAQPALDRLKRLAIPLVLNSSKTRAELRRLRQALALDTPFIAENGAVIDWGDGSGLGFAEPRQHLLDVLGRLREQGFAFEGFADWSQAEIAARTGLPLQEAALAAEREYTEPLLWQGGPESLAAFTQALAHQGLQAQQGGRFLTVMGQYSKGTAVQALRARYPGRQLIALGDSPNDLSLLEAADLAVVVKSPRSEALRPKVPTLRTRLPGPKGWNQAIEDILDNRS
ncbi:HAD-IIB family hydrolase [Gallaecimonas kandeliae]|uniref:HAD-IIB family hydrolase n=1 Tax=Gallaecimonas kandeliae TaxID=3029055 RepID=UPI0026480E82|nr:HAD-IIB family hydrolase [Gallaecimonas kandeliae]WKE64837.1 HAD-IIB family hydrolase [Gallaecimonas kandeliae]